MMRPRVSNLNLSDLTDPEFFHPEKAELNLSNQRLTDKEILEFVIPFLKSHPEITMLNVENNYIGTKGTDAIKALASITHLTTLNISKNYIMDEGARILASSTSLIRLEMRHTGIGSLGAKALASNPNLTTLDVTYNCTQIDGLKALAEPNPEERAKNGMSAGVTETEKTFPSLRRLSAFAVRQYPVLNHETLPPELAALAISNQKI